MRCEECCRHIYDDNSGPSFTINEKRVCYLCFVKELENLCNKQAKSIKKLKRKVGECVNCIDEIVNNKLVFNSRYGQALGVYGYIDKAKKGTKKIVCDYNKEISK